ncbi:MAG TPA: ABC transporter substrate-binding protein [Nitrososphaerales archaeon]|nr:ABC transporter substrate-binding protein [Nitrososphaerales archaeon]
MFSLKQAITGITIAIIIVIIVVAGAIVAYYAISSQSGPTSHSTSSSTPTLASSSSSSLSSSFSSPTIVSASSSGALTPVTIGSAVAFSEVYYLPMIIAQEKGFWAQHGLEVTWQKFNGGPAETAALAAGQIGIGLTGCGVIFDAVTRGIGIKNIGTYMNTTEFSIIVASNSTIKTLNDLNGTTLAVTSTTGLEQAYAQIVASKNHLHFNYVTTGGLPNSLALVESGKAQALDFTVGSVASQIQSGLLRNVYNDSAALPTPWAEFCIAATNNFIQSNPTVLKEVDAAFSQTIQFILNNPSFAEQVVLNFTKSNSNVASLVYNSVKASWNPSLSIDATALTNVDNVYLKYGITPNTNPASVNQTYTTEFLQS